MNSPCGHKEATCVVGNYWECTACITKQGEAHKNYGCTEWGWNCGSPDCEYPHKFKIGDRVRFTKDNPKTHIAGTVSKYLKHSDMSNQKCNIVSWDDGGTGCILDHELALYTIGERPGIDYYVME